jgi:RND family efflux transporter MFP subunit
VEKTELLNQLRIDRGDEEQVASRRWLWVSLVAVTIIAAGLIAWLGSREVPVAVRVAAARAMPAGGASASVLDATGYVTARRLATVSAKITGKVREVRIEEGQRVEEGEVLATLDDTDAQAQVALSRAQLESARSQVAEIQANLNAARRELRRQEDLSERKLGTAQALDAAQTQVEALQARYQSQQRSVDVAQESLGMAQVQLDNTIVRAPFAGVITVKAAQPGEMISPISAGGGFTRTGIGTIVDMDSLEVQVDVNEAYINRVQSNQPVEAILNAYPDWKIPAHVIAIIPTADRTRATVKVRIALDERDERIVPDMGVRVAFLEERKPDAQTQQAPRGVLVPSGAIRDDAGSSVVFVVREGLAKRRPVTVGGTLGDSRQVLSGLAAGESVVVEGPADLADGASVVKSDQG